MSKLVRIEFEYLDKELQIALKPRVDRLGYLGEFFKCMAHQSNALISFMEFTDNAKAELPKNIVEIIALSVACRIDNDYERNQHQRLCVRLGYSNQWIKAVERLEPERNSHLSDDERVVQRYVLKALSDHGKNAGSEFDEVVEILGDAGATAVLMVLGRYVTHSLVVNTLGLAPPVPSVFEDGFSE